MVKFSDEQKITSVGHKHARKRIHLFTPLKSSGETPCIKVQLKNNELDRSGNLLKTPFSTLPDALLR